MYLPPSQTEEQRKAIKNKFTEYLEVIQPLLEEYNAHCHWAKIELPQAPPLTSPSSTPPTSFSDNGNSYIHTRIHVYVDSCISL
jgi:hypothetical protein